MIILLVNSNTKVDKNRYGITNVTNLDYLGEMGYEHMIRELNEMPFTANDGVKLVTTKSEVVLNYLRSMCPIVIE